MLFDDLSFFMNSAAFFFVLLVACTRFAVAEDRFTTSNVISLFGYFFLVRLSSQLGLPNK